VAALIEAAVAFAEESPSPEPADTLKHVFFTQETHRQVEGES
jgi:TPP-dependent pyruvate/acetoin dehydrogenase alpha subunit